MTAELQKAIDYTLIGMGNTFYLFDDIPIVSKSTDYDHMIIVRRCHRKIDEENLRINLGNCHFAKQGSERLDHKITETGMTPLHKKVTAFQE